MPASNPVTPSNAISASANHTQGTTGHTPRWAIAAVRLLGSRTNAADQASWNRPLVSAIARSAQGRAERLHARMRADLLKSDEWLGDAIGFVGEME